MSRSLMITKQQVSQHASIIQSYTVKERKQVKMCPQFLILCHNFYSHANHKRNQTDFNRFKEDA